MHAGEEQDDFMILFNDYRKAGGAVARHRRAARATPAAKRSMPTCMAWPRRANPIGLLGAIYIIEGTGQRIVPALLPLIKAGLKLPPEAFRFLEYHGHNDENHLHRWLAARRDGDGARQRGQARRGRSSTPRATPRRCT